MHDYFVPGDTVVFRAYAVDGKTHKILTANAVKYFYVDDPEPAERQVQVRPEGAGAQRPVRVDWHMDGSGTTRSGLVDFKVLVQSKTKLRGSFVQMPVADLAADDLEHAAGRRPAPARHDADARPAQVDHGRLTPTA